MKIEGQKPYEEVKKDLGKFLDYQLIRDDMIEIDKYTEYNHVKGTNPPVKVEKLPNRNSLCPCGSEKKFKKCCLKLK